MALQEKQLQTTTAHGPAEPARHRHIGFWVTIGALAVIVAVLGAMLLSPMVTTTKGEGIANDMMAAWNSGSTVDLPNLYAGDAIMYVSGGGTSVETYDFNGIMTSASLMQARGFKIERIGDFTESPNLIAYPATITTDAETAQLMVVYRYDDSGKVVEHWAIWQQP